MFGLDFWVQIDSIDQPIKSNSVGSGNMSHRRASSLYDHLDHCFVVFKHTHNKASWCKIVRLREQDQHYPNHWSFFGVASARESCEDKQRVSPFYHGSEFCFQRLKQSDPINQERECRLTSILHPKRWFLILSNCVKLKFASHTSNLFEQIKCMTSKTHNVPPDVDFNPQELPQNRSLETVLHCFAVLTTSQYCWDSHV